MVTNREKITEKIFKARSRILYKNGFFGNLLLSLKLSFSEEIDTAATDGRCIYFNEKFMEDLTIEETEFIILHETMHVALNHMERGKDKNQFLYNVAADIVINSCILKMYQDISMISIHGQESMNTVPGAYAGDQMGYLYTTEEVYYKLLSNPKIKKLIKLSGFIDDHSHWDEADINKIKENIIKAHLSSTSLSSRGNLPGEFETYLNKLVSPKIDWRVYLNDFIQDEIYDYSFTPPDNRFSSYDFFLPGFNERDEKIDNIVFAVDTSGSMDDDDICNCYSEISGAIAQFNGRIKGYLIEFDSAIQAVYEINDDFDISKIKTKGRGGTDFEVVTNYIFNDMKGIEIKKLIILTDGYATYLKKEDIRELSLLYILTNDRVDHPEVGEYTIIEK